MNIIGINSTEFFIGPLLINELSFSYFKSFNTNIFLFILLENENAPSSHIVPGLSIIKTISSLKSAIKPSNVKLSFCANSTESNCSATMEKWVS